MRLSRFFFFCESKFVILMLVQAAQAEVRGQNTCVPRGDRTIDEVRVAKHLEGQGFGGYWDGKSGRVERQA